MRRLLLPILILAAALTADHLGLARGWVSPLIGRTVLVLSVLLAWRFHRGRVAWAVALVALLLETQPSSLVHRGVATLLPLNFAVLAWLHDWRILSGAGVWRGLIFLGQIGGLLLLNSLGLTAWLTAPLDLGPRLAWLNAQALSAIGLISFLAGGLILIAALTRRRSPIEAGLLGALGASLPALLAPSVDGGAFFFTVAGLILGLSLIENAFALAFEDGLTGLPARRSLEETLRHLGRTYSIAMLDLDHFKRFNDRHGHEVGDQILQMVGAKMARVRGRGKAFRYGGEEFSVVFPGKNAIDAEPFMEELRGDIADSSFKVRSPSRPKKKPKGAQGGRRGVTTKSLRVTVSIGLAERGSKNRTPEEVMKAADKALYRSKKAGRNRVTVGA